MPSLAALISLHFYGALLIFFVLLFCRLPFLAHLIPFGTLMANASSDDVAIKDTLARTLWKLCMCLSVCVCACVCVTKGDNAGMHANDTENTKTHTYLCVYIQAHSYKLTHTHTTTLVCKRIQSAYTQMDTKRISSLHFPHMWFSFGPAFIDYFYSALWLMRDTVHHKTDNKTLNCLPGAFYLSVSRPQ